ncbi:LysE family translocator [Rhodoferax ferrireducens]|uniref:LysE family translocator n=1 Tax=Rhodoferax ferrireducens TaxID=192843 RepID=UPI000E0D0995|nr:LysE family translocator [Rhodoferax ferrireducens]
MSPILFSMFLFSLAGAISPGPVNLIAASIGANAGFFRALPHVTGASVSYLAIVWLVGSGLQNVLLAYPEITGLLKYLGGAYLLYLAARIATAKPATNLQCPQTRSAGMMQGVLSQSLNPKAWLVAMSGVSLFVTAAQNASVLLLVFCGMSGVVCFFSIATWAALGKLIGKWLANATYQLLFNRVMASLLAAAVVSMLLGT